jgi:hypothetical protein
MEPQTPEPLRTPQCPLRGQGAPSEARARPLQRPGRPLGPQPPTKKLAFRLFEHNLDCGVVTERGVQEWCADVSGVFEHGHDEGVTTVLVESSKVSRCNPEWARPLVRYR